MTVSETERGWFRSLGISGQKRCAKNEKLKAASVKNARPLSGFVFRTLKRESTNMKAGLTTAMSLLLLLSATAHRAAAAEDGHAIEILGFQLGMSPDQVASNAKANLKDAVISPRAGTLILDSYKMPEIPFGADIKEGETTAWYGTPNAEYMKFTYSLDENPKVIYISRYRKFDKDTAPAIDTFLKAVISKYGKPVFEDHRGEGTPYLLTWNYGASVKRTPGYSNDNILFGNCNTWVSVSFGQNPFAAMEKGDVNFGQDDLRAYPRCGTTMTLSVIPMPPDNVLALAIEFDIGDFKALVASHDGIWKRLKAGAAAAAQSLKTKGADKSPKL